MRNLFWNVRLCSAIGDGEWFDLPLVGGVQNQIALHTLIFLGVYVGMDLRSYGWMMALAQRWLVDWGGGVVKGDLSTVVYTDIGFPFEMATPMSKTLTRSLRHSCFARRRC